MNELSQRGRALSRESGETDVLTVFQESRGLIHATFVSHYRIGEREATELERDLQDWFIRFCRRKESPPAREARPTLLLMACVFGRSFQKYLLETGDRPWDERLERLLRREPVAVAREVSRGLRLLYHRLHEPGSH